MCGLFGFYGSHKPDRFRLAGSAELAARRGPDAWGLVTEFASRRDIGRLSRDTVMNLPPSRYMIGHCRLATVLNTKRVESCQPIKVGRFIVAHNGTVPNADVLAAKYSFTLKTGNDSEAIGHLINLAKGQLHYRLSFALGEIEHKGHFAVTVLDLDSMAIQISARGIPLWRHVAQEGTYWCSIRPGEEWEPVHG